MSQQYSFPLLDEPDMIAFLSDINFPFQQAWKKPTPQMVTEIYTALVDIVVGIDRDRLSRPETAIMEKHTINQDVYSRGLPELGMLMMIFSVMESCCVHTFSLRDITAPTWPRLRTILSGVVNFVRFQHEFFNVFEGKIEQTHELENELEHYQTTRITLQQQYDEFVGSPEVRLLKQLQEQSRVLEEEFEEKKKHREGLEIECRSNASKLKLAAEKVTALDETIKGLHYELDLLKGKDVTGLLHDVEDLRVKVELQSQQADVSQQDVLILHSKTDYNNKYLRTLSTLITELGDYQSTTILYNETISKISIFQAQLDTLNVQSLQLQATKEELTEELSQLKDDLTNASLRYDSVINEKQDEIRRLLAQKRQCESTDSDNQLQIDEIELEIISSKNYLSHCVEKHQMQIDTAIHAILTLGEKLNALLHKPVSETIFLLEQEQNTDIDVDHGDGNRD